MTLPMPTRDQAFGTLERRIGWQYGIEPRTMDTLRAIDHETRTLSSGDVLHHEGGEERRMYCVESGWLLATHGSADGRRTVLRIYVPGDLVGWEDINWTYASATVTASADCVLTAFPKMQVHEIFRLSQQTSWILHVVSSVDYVWATDFTRVIGRLSAEDRIAYLILQLRSRQAFLEAGPEDYCFCPMTQTDVGDAVGLTNVSVSRSTKALREAGLIEVDSRGYRLLDIPTLVARTDFVDRLSINKRTVFPERMDRRQTA